MGDLIENGEREIRERIIQKAFGVCMWVTRKADLARRGESMLSLRCNVMIDKWIKELIKVCNDAATETKPFRPDGSQADNLGV